MNQTEKVVRRLKTQAAIAEVTSVRLRQAGDYGNAEDWIRTSRELYNIINLLTALLDQQGEPVGATWNKSGDVNWVGTPPPALSKLYLHPPASLEGKADYKDLRDFVEECAKPPYGDSSAESLLAWVEGRAQTLLRTTAPPASRGGVKEVLRELYSWVKNWDPNFIYDDEWPNTRAKVDHILSEGGEG